MYRYGPMCVVTDIMSWVFFIFVVLPMVSVTVDGGMLSELIDFTGGNTYGITEGVTTASALVLSGAPLSDVEGFLPVAVLFQSLWCIEQYWMQVWAIHIVRTNKLPFFQAWSSKILVATTIIALAVGTILPFTGPLWEAISGCDALIGVPIWALIWMPFIACVYFFGAHAIKKHMLKTRGYFAC